MYSRKRSRDASAGAEVVPKTSQSAAEVDANNPVEKSKWGESVLEKWRGALVKARLALQKKREKKKERLVKSTLARLRKIADTTRGSEQSKVQKNQRKTPEKPPAKKKQIPRATTAERAVAVELIPTKVPKKARTTEISHAKVEPVEKPIVQVTRASDVPTTSTSCPSDVDASRRVEMGRKEEIRNKWKGTLEIAQNALQQKREHRKDQMKKAPVARIEAPQGETQEVVEFGFSLKRPSVDELRDFAKQVR